MSDTFTLCTEADQVQASLDILKHAAFLIVDCEGHELGCRDGSLSLISIGTPKFSEVFVYDAMQLGNPGLEPLLQLLASPEVMKVVWDGRMDFSEIYHTFGTRLENIIDLQIVEVISRARRGEREGACLARLKNYFSAFAVVRSTPQYEGLQIVVGMKRCLDEHALALGNGKDVKVKKMHDQNQSKLWMERPLSTDLLNYAAKDIHLIHLIYDYFKSQGYLDSQPTLLAQSQRYVCIHADLALKPLRDDYFRRSPVVPLDILEEPRGAVYSCKACVRQLSLPCFRQSGPSHRRMVCKACHAIGMKNRGRGEEVDDGWVAH